MKNFVYISLVCLCTLSINMSSCSDDNELFLQRSHDTLQFAYLHSTKEMLVLSNGHWSVSSDDKWISISPDEGTGDGKKEQTVEVTVEQNNGVERTGSINLFNSEKTLKIQISQEDGFFTMNDPTVASGFNLYEELINKKVEVPYQKAKPGDKVNVTATLEGPGAEGLSIESLTDYSLEVGSGTVPLSLTGTPTQKGTIEIKILVEVIGSGKQYDLTAESRSKLAGEVVVNLFKLLPRMVILDWGDYEKGTGTNGNNGTPRSFIIELAETEDGPAIRRYESKTTDWLVSNSMFFDHNRFAFANLQPNTTYWFRIVARELGPNKEDSDVTTLEFTTPKDETLGANVILYKDFDNFWWGGCSIYQAFSVKVTDAQIGKNLNPDSPDVMATGYPICNPVTSLSDMFAQAKSTTHNISPVKAPLYWNFCWEGDKYGTNYGDDDYTGWQGYWVRLNTGSVLLSTATIQGYLKTPKLTGIGEGASNITVTVHSAPYFEPYHSWGEDCLQHYIQIEGPGTITDGGPSKAEPTGAATANSDKQVTVQCNTNVNNSTHGPAYSYTIPTEHIVKVSGATKETRIVVKSHPYGTAHYRLNIDDIKITKD